MTRAARCLAWLLLAALLTFAATKLEAAALYLSAGAALLVALRTLSTPTR